MKKLIIFFFLGALLCSCSSELNEQNKQRMLTYNITSENYELFFNVEHNRTYKKTIVTPMFNKHINYESVIFNFKNSYSIMTSKTGTYNYSVNVDDTGNGETKNIDTNSSLTSSDCELISAGGIVSFKNDYTTYEKIEKIKRDAFHKESFGAYFNTYGKTSYALIFKADLNFSKTADTDAFYLIESVHVKFTATVNNSTKDFEYDLHPNFFGVAEIPTNDDFSNITNTSFTYTNGYYLAY